MLFSLANRLEHAQLIKADGMSSVLYVSMYTTDVNQGFIQDFKLGGGGGGGGGNNARGIWGHSPPEKFRFLHTLRLILKPSLSQIYTPEKRVLTEWKFHLVVT